MWETHKLRKAKSEIGGWRLYSKLELQEKADAENSRVTGFWEVGN